MVEVMVISPFVSDSGTVINKGALKIQHSWNNVLFPFRFKIHRTFNNSFLTKTQDNLQPAQVNTHYTAYNNSHFSRIQTKIIVAVQNEVK